MKVPIDQIENELTAARDVQLFLLREDLNHPFIQGNKFRKLKYNLLHALKNRSGGILSFGGPYSNHLFALAAAGKEFGLKTIGMVRAYPELPDTETLAFCKQQGMQIIYLSRKEYGQKNDSLFLESLQGRFPDFLILPEGGSNAPAIEGCAEIVTDNPIDCDYICVPFGSGGTSAGVIKSLKQGQTALCFLALKGEGFENSFSAFLKCMNIPNKGNYRLISDYHFGGFAKMTDELFEFCRQFKSTNGILLDPIYTGKMMYGIFDMIRNNYFPAGSRIMAIHTGGLQAWSGYAKFTNKIPDFLSAQKEAVHSG